MTKQTDVILLEVVDSLDSIVRTLTGITAVAASHEVRLLELEGKPVPKEVRDTQTRAMLRAAEEGYYR